MQYFATAPHSHLVSEHSPVIILEGALLRIVQFLTFLPYPFMLPSIIRGHHVVFHSIMIW